MKVVIKEINGTWKSIKDTTLTTIGKNTGKEPDSNWKRKLLMSEHSPIRRLKVNWKWFDLKYWVSVHFVRHKIGIEHWVSTQRTDRTNIVRDELPQNSFVMHEAEADAQAIINISRKRLCNCASKETREAWQEVLNELKKYEPELVSVCVKECVYRGFCPEFISCGYHKTEAYKKELEEYRKGINE